MVERIVISPPPGSRLGSPEVRPTGRLTLTDRQEQVIKGQEEERARQAQLGNLASRYNNRFDPELRAAIAAQQELGRNSTAAADYITQIGMERRKEEIQRGLLGADQPNGLAGKAVDIGGDLARDQNTIGSLSGLLGDIDYKGILNQLVKTFQRPEMLTPGVSPLTAFGMSGAALNQAEMAGAAAEQERMDKLALEQIKNAPGAPSFNSTQTELFQSVSQGSQILDSLQRAKEILLQSKITGAGPAAIEVGKNILKAFGIDPGVGGRKEYEQKVAELKAYVSGQRVFGREMNKQELKILDTLASNPGLFNSNSELMGQLDAFIRRVNTTVGTNRRILEQQGFGQASRFINEPPTSVFRD